MRESLKHFLRGQPIDAPKGNLPHLPRNNLRSHPPQNRKANLIENPDFLDAEEEAYETERIAYEEMLDRYYRKDYFKEEC